MEVGEFVRGGGALAQGEALSTGVVGGALNLRRGGSFGGLQDKPGVLQALLVHANLVTTARYLHPDKAQVQAMVEEM